LLGDVEKLLKKKAELEPIEFEDDRPRGRINTGRRHWGEEDPRDVLDAPHRESRPARSAPRPAPLDPFFTQPYEAPQVTEPASEPVVSNRVSGNIKPKKKVAALFK